MTITTLPEHLKPMVEKAARRIFNASCGGLLPDWVEESKWNEAVAIAEADALAFLNACLEGGVAREGCAGPTFRHPNHWSACTRNAHIKITTDQFPALILNLGEAK